MTLDDYSNIVHMVVVGSIFVSFICRARHMDKRTLPVIRLQHGLLNAGALISLVVPEGWASAAIGAGVAAFMLLSSPRWRHGAPEGTIDRRQQVSLAGK